MSTTTFEPRIVSFLCNWCSYAGAEQAGAAQRLYPHNVSAIRIMCTGRMDAQFVLKAFEQGADEAIILGCHPGDCHYKEQNYRMVQRHRIILRVLKQFGIDPRRCHLECVSASEGEKFAQVMGQVVETIKGLGPLPVSSR